MSPALSFAALSILLAPVAHAAPLPPLTESPRPIAPNEAGMGKLVPLLSATDLDGKAITLTAASQAPARVLAFISPSCPLSAKLLPTLAVLEAEFAAKGAGFCYIDPTASDKEPELRDALARHGLKGRCVMDRDLKIAAALGATTTTEVFVIDGARTLIYRGAVDDQYGLGYAKDAPANEWLRNALDAVLKGERPRIAATSAPGCALSLPDKTVVEKAETPVWHARYSRILQANCVECHRTGGIAPFSLETYEDAVSHAGMMKKVVAKGTMPPWFAAPLPDAAHSPFMNDRSLPAADKADLLTWLESSRPQGNPADAPAPRKFADAEWAFGTPDTILEIPRAVAVKATGRMDYVHMDVPTSFTEDRWVQSIEVLPTARAQVHHVLVFVVMPDKSGRPGRVRDGNNFFAAYVPGSNLLQYPAGYAKRLPKGAVLRFQLHYTPNGTATEDRTRLGLKFTAPPRYEVQVAAAMNHKLLIPPGAADHTEKAVLPVVFDSQIMAFMPHMHVRGKSFKYELVKPDHTRRTVLEVPRYDFNWQLLYRLGEPLSVARGSRIEVTAVFDNSAGNPANPDPAKAVRWGEQTEDEMLLGYLEYVNPAHNPSAGQAKETVLLTGKALGVLGKRLDKDGDERVSLEEAGPLFAKLHRQLDANDDGYVDGGEARRAVQQRAQ